MSCGQQDDQGISSASIRRMAQLEEFKARHGHTWVSTDQHSKFYVKGLGGWVLAQRKARRRGEMSAHLEDALDELGFSWTGPPRKLADFHQQQKKRTLGIGGIGRTCVHAHDDATADVNVVDGQRDATQLDIGGKLEHADKMRRPGRGRRSWGGRCLADRR